MTVSAEASADSRRRALEQVQESVLPSGRVTVSCSAPLGVGGLGRHLQEILDALQRRGQPARGVYGSLEEAPPNSLRRPLVLDPLVLLARSPLPLSPALRTRGWMVGFDARAAGRLEGTDHLIAFNGQALHQFRAARRAHVQSVGLVSGNPHIRRVARQHARARRQYPLEGSWTTHLVRRNLREYAAAGRIYVSSEYMRESFLEEGVSSELLAKFPLSADPRYRPRRPEKTSGTFDIAYVGSLTVHKGVPLLIDAVRGLPHDDLRLRLIGGWATRKMRRYIQAACAADPRISAGPGDPLERLQAADLYVHPAYEDGFGYAAAEALACGVPVIVSSETGMQELIDAPRDGLVFPAGDLVALSAAIDAAYQGQLFAFPEPSPT